MRSMLQFGVSQVEIAHGTQRAADCIGVSCARAVAFPYASARHRRRWAGAKSQQHAIRRYQIGQCYLVGEVEQYFA